MSAVTLSLRLAKPSGQNMANKSSRQKPAESLPPHLPDDFDAQDEQLRAVLNAESLEAQILGIRKVRHKLEPESLGIIQSSGFSSK
jgi:hypothetical protein